jgi:hypothetical protein
MAEEKKWMGAIPEKCDLCKSPLTTTFTDGSIFGTNHWAIMCPKCHAKVGNGVGTGKGQTYDVKTGIKTLG